jgi:pantoate--beta-alanine ligase
LLIFKEIAPLRAYLNGRKLKGDTVGFVPTMGALHQGHIALVAESIANHTITVSSIFVNPTQFNNQEDLVKYPRTIERDIELLEAAGCDVLFHPEAAEMYPNGFATKHYEWQNITNSLEGAFRPGHFDGVITIVNKLFEAVEPHAAYFGQKDFQQCAVIGKMISEFNLSITMHVCPTLREPDGLAMSSRNVRLSSAERADALLVFEALRFIKQHQHSLPINELIKNAERILLKSAVMKPEYISVVETDSLNPAETLLPQQKYVALIATWCGNVRLIDNMLLQD